MRPVTNDPFIWEGGVDDKVQTSSGERDTAHVLPLLLSGGVFISPLVHPPKSQCLMPLQRGNYTASLRQIICVQVSIAI